MGLGISPLKGTTELAKLRWFRNIVRIGDERHPKMAWQARTEEKRPKRRP
jgi:hypothetical protein